MEEVVEDYPRTLAELESRFSSEQACRSALGAEKGINLPESELRVSPLTGDDIQALEFVARQADLVGYSFVRTESDIHDLQARLQKLGGKHPGIILKIETREAFEQLPSLLLAAMRSPKIGVMIARGDLAVECGYQRFRKKSCGCVRPHTFPSSGQLRFSSLWLRKVLPPGLRSRMQRQGNVRSA